MTRGCILTSLLAAVSPARAGAGGFEAQAAAALGQARLAIAEAGMGPGQGAKAEQGAEFRDFVPTKAERLLGTARSKGDRIEIEGRLNRRFVAVVSLDRALASGRFGEVTVEVFPWDEGRGGPIRAITPGELKYVRRAVERAVDRVPYRDRHLYLEFLNALPRPERVDLGFIDDPQRLLDGEDISIPPGGSVRFTVYEPQDQVRDRPWQVAPPAALIVFRKTLWMTDEVDPSAPEKGSVMQYTFEATPWAAHGASIAVRMSVGRTIYGAPKGSYVFTIVVDDELQPRGWAAP